MRLRFVRVFRACAALSNRARCGCGAVSKPRCAFKVARAARRIGPREFLDCSVLLQSAKVYGGHLLEANDVRLERSNRVCIGM